MISLDLPRDEQGRYVLDAYPERGYEKSEITTLGYLSIPRSDSYWIEKGSDRFVVKSEHSRSYFCAQYGELLYSIIAKANGIACADVDAGLLDGEDCVISKDVCSVDGERIIYDYLTEGIVNLEYSAENIIKVMYTYAQGNGLKVEENIRNKIYKLMIFDFLCAHEDRHPGNMMFEIVEENGEKVLRLCPVFDNECAFMFVALRDHVEIDCEDEPEITELDIDRGIDFALSLCDTSCPFLGTNFDVDAYRMNIRKSLKDDILNSNAQKKTMEYYVNALAFEIVNNEELKNFYQKVVVDLRKAAQTLSEQIGFDIPEKYLSFAETVYQRRKQMLDKAILLQTEPGSNK